MVRRLIEMFDKRARTYDKEEINKYRQYLIKKVIEYTKPKKTDIVLDIGTGSGAVVLAIAGKVKRVIGIDISRKMLKVAREKAEAAGVYNVEFRFGSFLSPNVEENSIDIIISTLALHHLRDEEKKKSIMIMRKVLKPNGKVLIGDVMFFFDPAKEPWKLKWIEWILRRVAPTSSKRLISHLRSEYPPKVEDLVKFFKSSGFQIEKIKKILPFVGVICARKR